MPTEHLKQTGYYFHLDRAPHKTTMPYCFLICMISDNVYK